MALLPLILAAVIFLATLPASHAEDESPARAHRGAEVRFVPPGAAGTVSLGIYDTTGKLVRVLCDEWTFNRFRIGLNGLSTVWDGLDDAGQPVPAGTYQARGYVVGEVEVTGEAFHFNDWIDSPDSPLLVSVAAAQLLPGGDVLLAARLAGETGALIRYSPESEARWNTVVSGPRPQPAKNVQLAVSDQIAFVLLDGVLQAASLDDGAAVETKIAVKNPRAISARGAQLAVLEEQALKFFAVPDFAPQGETKLPSASVVSVALLDKGSVAATEEGQLWLWQNDWTPVDVPADIKIRRVETGRGDTFWALEENADGALSVAQYSPTEGNLARWTPSAADGRVAWLAGAQDRDYFVATLVTEDTQRTVAIRRQSVGGGWEYVFDKKITRSSEFGWAQGKLVPSGGEQPLSMELVLGENLLDPQAPRVLAVRAVADDSGTGLATDDGLPLLRVSGEAGYERVLLVPGTEPDSARFFQGNGVSVEEFSFADLGDITAFDAGTLTMSGEGREATPPPPEEPSLPASPAAD